MKLCKDQKGVTLVELLGALTLVCVLALGVFATLSNSLNLFQKETIRIDVRGQANIIANQLTTFYQENRNFEITREGDVLEIKSETPDGVVETREFSLPGHQITIETDSPIETAQFTKMGITITITGENEPFILETIVSRLREET